VARRGDEEVKLEAHEDVRVSCPSSVSGLSIRVEERPEPEKESATEKGLKWLKPWNPVTS